MHDITSLYEQCLSPTMVDAYLRRIGYDGPRDGSAAALAQIQQRHLLSVPYENLDILRGTALSLAVPDLFDKIVTRRRGGFCFELNGLFGYLLRALGYEVTDFTARFMLGQDRPVMRRHRVLKVLAQGQYYLCDVGTGVVIPRVPLRMRLGVVQEQPFGTYQLLWDDFYGWELYDLHQGQWRRIYSFTEEPQLDLDFEAPCFHCERHADSIFNKTPMLSIRTATGRVTIDDHDLRIFDGDTVDTYVLPSGADFHAALEKYFGIELAHNP